MFLYEKGKGGVILFFRKSKRLCAGDRVIHIKTGEVLTVSGIRLGNPVPIKEMFRRFPVLKKRICFVSCTNGKTYKNKEIIVF